LRKIRRLAFQATDQQATPGTPSQISRHAAGAQCSAQVRVVGVAGYVAFRPTIFRSLPGAELSFFEFQSLFQTLMNPLLSQPVDMFARFLTEPNQAGVAKCG